MLLNMNKLSVFALIAFVIIVFVTIIIVKKWPVFPAASLFGNEPAAENTYFMLDNNK